MYFLYCILFHLHFFKHFFVTHEATIVSLSLHLKTSETPELVIFSQHYLSLTPYFYVKLYSVFEDFIRPPDIKTEICQTLVSHTLRWFVL